MQRPVRPVLYPLVLINGPTKSSDGKECHFFKLIFSLLRFLQKNAIIPWLINMDPLVSILAQCVDLA